MYDINEHKHKYATWAASRAWNRGLKGGNFSLAETLINIANLKNVLGPDDIDTDVDAWLLEKMRLIVNYAANNDIPSINYGRAQKLVNIYLKTKLVCGGHEAHPKVCRLHPPIDRQLLNGIRVKLRLEHQKTSKAAEAFANAQKGQSSWTRFELDDYLAHIKAIKLCMGSKPLWMIEEHWG